MSKSVATFISRNNDWSFRIIHRVHCPQFGFKLLSTEKNVSNLEVLTANIRQTVCKLLPIVYSKHVNIVLFSCSVFVPQDGLESFVSM